MDYLETIGQKVGLGNVDYDNVKKQASFFLRDKINSARLLLTGVTTCQLLAEEATNDDQWGPATRTMAAIVDSCRQPDEYPRIMQVLHGRLALIGKKYWRQFLKTLTVIEFLLFHGPEKIVAEFSLDKDLIEDLTRFNYVSERGVDHGLVVRKKAKQVLKLLTEDDYLREERSRAQKLSKTIFGQGSYQSSGIGSGASRYSGFGNTPTSSSSSDGLMFDTDPDDYHVEKKFTAFEERILSEKRGNRQEKSRHVAEENSTSDWKAFEDDITTFSFKQSANDSNWADFSNTSPGMSPKVNGSPSSTMKDDTFNEEVSPPHPPQISTSGNLKTSVQSPRATPKLPVNEFKKVQSTAHGPRRSKSKIKMGDLALATSSGEFKLPPPPPPPGGFKAPIAKPKPQPLAQSVGDLLDFGSENTGSAIGSDDNALLSFETPSNVSRSDQAIIDLLTISTASTRLTDFDSLNTHSSVGKESIARSSGLTQLAPDLFDFGSKATENNSDAFGFLSNQTNQTNVIKNEASLGGILNFMDLNKETSTTTAQDLHSSINLDLFGEQVLPAKAPSSSFGLSSLEDQTFLSERSKTGSDRLPEVAPDPFNSMAFNFASFGVRDAEKKPAAKPADDFFNLLS